MFKNLSAIHVMLVLFILSVILTRNVNGYYNNTGGRSRNGKFLFDALFGLEEIDFGAVANSADSDGEIKDCNCGRW